MSVKETLVNEINELQNPQLLKQFLEYIQKTKKSKPVPNAKKVLQFAGILTDAASKKISKSVNQSFNKIEGEW